MLANMSEIDRGAQAPPGNWSDVGQSVLLPTGTVTLLLADVEGSTRLWETQPEEMTAAVALLDRTVSAVITSHNGVRPVEQGEGDSFVVAFARASDAVACALNLQRAPLVPIRLRIGVHTGEIQRRDEGNYIGPTINRTARLRDLAHGGQTVLSGTTGDLVADRLPPDVWLTDLGTHPLRDLLRPVRVVQLCHPDLNNDFPPLRAPKPVVAHNLPVQLTSFVGRGEQISDVRHILADNRLVTLTGAGGAGKTRLAVQIAAQIAGEFGDGALYVDLAAITDPDIVPVAVARALGLPDQPGRSTMDTLTRFLRDQQMLVVLDNCEHLLDASAALIVALFGACPGLTLLATSREPIGVAGEVSWRVPSLSLGDEAIELFSDRARRARPDFRVDGDAVAVAEICRRLDGMPLAIELAAARVRALSVTEILGSLHDRFRLLTGGARTAVRRQQTLRASVDWSHALLTEPERSLFRRLGVFLGGFDLQAAQAVGASTSVEQYQVMDQLSLLVDKSLVVADEVWGTMRYRLLETVRQYALEKLGESSEADAVRNRHRDHYTERAADLGSLMRGGDERLNDWADVEIDNLRAAFTWSHESADFEHALQLASSLQPLWLTRGRIREGLTWFDAVLTDDPHHLGVAPVVHARALADRAVLVASRGAYDSMDQTAQQALAIARELDDPALLARALTACGGIAAYDAKTARPYLTEAIELARALGDRWTLSQALGWLAYAADTAGEPIVARAAAEEGRQLADAIGDHFQSRRCRHRLGLAQAMQGELSESIAQFREVAIEADAAHDLLSRVGSLLNGAQMLAYHGDTSAAQATIDAAFETVAEVSEFMEGWAYAVVAITGLAAGDVAAATDASEAAWQRLSVQRDLAAINLNPMSEVALARGDLVAARRWADDAVSTMTGWHLATALTTRARVAIAQGEPAQAERDAYDALACAATTGSQLALPDIFECLAGLAGQAGTHRQAAQHFGAADTLRQRTGAARYKIHDADYRASVAAVRNAMGQQDFDTAWTEGTALSAEEAITYAQRGRGERKRPTSGWESLTPTERDVVRLVSEGLANKDIAARLFVSPRTVQTHLTHVYTKLDLTSRVQLCQVAARHT
jgi:predicted ATPase/class 3 adenylate cyclase/DNA-binding CsgD family transcriptional regulator